LALKCDRFWWLPVNLNPARARNDARRVCGEGNVDYSPRRYNKLASVGVNILENLPSEFTRLLSDLTSEDEKILGVSAEEVHRSKGVLRKMRARNVDQGYGLNTDLCPIGMLAAPKT
jgi:hypothetical protein